MRLLLPQELDTAQVAIHIAAAKAAEPTSVPGRVVRVASASDGQVEVGVHFGVHSAPLVIQSERAHA
jgi:hypothetical protein